MHLFITKQNLKVCEPTVFVFKVDVQRCLWAFFVILCYYSILCSLNAILQ